MYNHILVPVSFDDDRNAVASVEGATQLLSEGGKITLLHVMEQVPSYAVTYIPEGFHDEANKAIHASMNELAVGLDNAECVVVDGHSGRTILDWSNKHKPDCIVLASHSPGVVDYLMGGTAAQVVRHAKCAVLVMR